MPIDRPAQECRVGTGVGGGGWGGGGGGGGWCWSEGQEGVGVYRSLILQKVGFQKSAKCSAPYCPLIVIILFSDSKDYELTGFIVLFLL